MNPVDLMPVPLGGNRIPDSMKGSIVRTNNIYTNNNTNNNINNTNTNNNTDNNINTNNNTNTTNTNTANNNNTNTDTHNTNTNTNTPTMTTNSNTNMNISETSKCRSKDMNTSKAWTVDTPRDDNGECTSWRDLPESTKEPIINYGETFNAIMELRQHIHIFKKQLSGLSLPIKLYLLNTDIERIKDERFIQGELRDVDRMCKKIGEGVNLGRERTREDELMCRELREEVVNVLNTVECDVQQQASNIRVLCRTTLDKYKCNLSTPPQQPQEQHTLLLTSDAIKEIYGDFNLQLGVITRKIFAAQNKLLTLIKRIKKQHHTNTNTHQNQPLH